MCKDVVHEFFDFGRHPLSQAFLSAEDAAVPGREYRYRLAIGVCESCRMVQLLEEIPRERKFHRGYPYHSSGSTVMHRHFTEIGRRFLGTELSGDDPLLVEIGSNDGVTLRTVAEAGVRQLGFEPTGTGGAGRMHRAFFDAGSAREVRAAEGPADVIYSANTVCDIADIAEVFAGADALLTADGVLVFEDPYWGEIIERTSFDQIYDEHFYFFTASSVATTAARFGFELVDVERLPVHGGQLRYWLARSGRRAPAPAVAEVLAEEEARGLTSAETLKSFAATLLGIGDDLVALLRKLSAEGHSIVGYGATAKSSTVLNYCGIGPDLLPFICDTTPAKHGTVTPGSHIPVREAAAFRSPYPDYALLLAWNHAEEIQANEEEFRAAGGKWILYVPEVRIV
ncbi:class I SAM-dependent methyltransferase [Streptomyces sp. ventii]|uniref:Class I SAM-dependent methyltransferase n=1 Tax=Streptomyces spiramenti TaxID=2720606 RepID=A0ABX1AC94_9ACTN|nr:class I SAM-dependent methyltransferase [Streptomyces spiramenti]